MSWFRWSRVNWSKVRSDDGVFRCVMRNIKCSVFFYSKLWYINLGSSFGKFSRFWVHDINWGYCSMITVIAKILQLIPLLMVEKRFARRKIRNFSNFPSRKAQRNLGQDKYLPWHAKRFTLQKTPSSERYLKSGEKSFHRHAFLDFVISELLSSEHIQLKVPKVEFDFHVCVHMSKT